jgi:hypothetical protein
MAKLRVGSEARLHSHKVLHRQYHDLSAPEIRDGPLAITRSGRPLATTTPKPKDQNQECESLGETTGHRIAFLYEKEGSDLSTPKRRRRVKASGLVG